MERTDRQTETDRQTIGTTWFRKTHSEHSEEESSLKRRRGELGAGPVDVDVVERAVDGGGR